MKLSIKVVPAASREGISGWLGDVLKVRVVAAPEHGKANQAVVKVIAHALGVPAGDVRITRGRASSRKTVDIDSLAEPEVLRRLDYPGAGTISRRTAE